MDSLSEQFRLVPIINPKTGNDVVVNSKEYHQLVDKYGEPYKVRSPKTQVFITVGKATYNNLITDGYTPKEIIIGVKYKKRARMLRDVNKKIIKKDDVVVEKKITKKVIDIVHQDYALPIDAFIEIFKYMKTIDKINISMTNKYFNHFCGTDDHLTTLKRNMGYQTLACGYQNTFIIKDDKLYGIGSNTHGQFGLGVQGKGYGTGRPKLIPIPDNHKPLSVACGDDHMVVLTTGGLYGCGRNEYGQLTGKHKHYLTLTFISISGVKNIACGKSSTYVITATGVYVFGYYAVTGREYDKPLFINVPSPIMASIGFKHGAIVTKNGLYLFYEGSNPTFYNVDDVNDILDVSCCHSQLMILTTTGLYGINNMIISRLWGGPKMTPFREEITTKKLTHLALENVVHVSCGNAATYFMTKDNYVYAYGFAQNLNVLSDYHNPVVIPILLNNVNIVNICSSYSFTIMLDTNDIYYGNGSNYHKQLNGADPNGTFTNCKYFNK